MNIVMSYIDYSMANLSEREVFSCTKTQTETIYEKLKEIPGVLGSVLIATCNRTELYLSLEEGEAVNPFHALCEIIGADYHAYAHMNKTLAGDEAIIHLCKVASGAESQIWGDDQIVTQVDDALKTAQHAKATDSILNVVFRTGVSAGKKVKTLVDFKVDDNSTAARAVRLLKTNPAIRKVLVVGNGMIGRLVTELLVKEGVEATMTLRQYRHGENIVPPGAKTVNYSDRYEAISQSDAVVSATLSPHYTVYYEEVAALSRVPEVFIDLAVPRDIDPHVAALENVRYYDIDTLGRDERDARQEAQMKEIEKIIEKYIVDFHKWYSFRESHREKEAI
ncbi:glutamyl-tRNA reductase [Ihubacter sp. mB4P-1]|uniref:glutamyl-tRNA reductase n=1 Tax=Ihubacter sp. mB4P-1 TaxID=3242370 RepID=UPI001379CD65